MGNAGRATVRWVCAIFALSALLYSADDHGSPVVPDPFARSIQPFLAANCYACHNGALASGDLNLESYQTAGSVIEGRKRWEAVLRKLQAGEMPPKEMPRPDAAELKTVIEWIQGEFAGADRNAKPEAGRVTARRLNRTEYNNTVRDLLGVDLDPAGDFPQDDAVFGFDNIANALTVSPLLTEKYLAAAEKLVRAAVFGPDLKMATVRLIPDIPRRQEGANPIRIAQPPPYTMTDYDATGVSLEGAYHFTYKFPADGDYVIRVITTGSRPAGSEDQQVDLWIDGKIAHSFTMLDKVTVTNEKEPSFLDMPWKATAGEHKFIAAFPREFEGLPASFNGPNPSTKPAPAGGRGGFGGVQALQPLPADATPEQIAARKALEARIANGGGGRGFQPRFDGVAISEVDIIGPSAYKKGPSAENLHKLFVCAPSVPGCERRIISAFASRAFRRPVAADEVEDFSGVFSDARKRGRSFDQAIALSLEAVLVSPDFLFRIERVPAKGAGTSHAVSQYELASRLSYFLWSTMPDDELMRLAGQKTLSRPDVLEAQVRRMLRDPRSRALADNFASQWLETRRLESVKPDRDRFPDFDDYLRASMQEETARFFDNVVREDSSVLDFIDGQYSFLNERLARHYRIKGVTGPEFRKVDLTGSGRAGILTQASVLTVSAYGNRTSPVLRGKWILENLLNTPPPPPPPGVPPIDEAALGTTASMRQQLEVHRANAVCASCHSRMDPLGFALENYDAVGQWRTQDGKFPIDASATLPDGRTFQGADGLKKTLDSDRDGFVKCLAEKMLIYALGRGVESYDRATVGKIAEGVAANQYRFSSLALGIVNSMPFQMQREDGGTQ